MKRLFAILLIALFLFNTLGYYFVFSYNQHLVRSEMKDQVKAGVFKGSTIILNISDPAFNTDFKRVEKGEFIYRGNLYDIISEKANGNFTTFYCIHDKNEERLLAGLYNYFERAIVQKNPEKVKHSLAMIYHVIKLALPQTLHIQPPRVFVKISFINPTCPLSSVFYLPLSPPPNIS
jgi:hypothetical protein